MEWKRNSFEHTKIHNKFKELIEELLQFMITDIGINQEIFLLCAKKGLDISKDKVYWEQLISVENFSIF